MVGGGDLKSHALLNIIDDLALLFPHKAVIVANSIQCDFIRAEALAKVASFYLTSDKK